MKARDFFVFISAVADMLDEANSHADALVWREVSYIFNVKPSATVSELCKMMDDVKPSDSEATPTLESFTRVSASVQKLLASAGVKIGQKKRTLRDDLDEVVAVISSIPSTSAAALAESVRAKLNAVGGAKSKPVKPKPDVLTTYLPRLEETLGDEARFTEVFNRLKADKLVGAPEAKKLSKAFAKETARTKTQALDQIWAHHASLIDSRAKAAATAGRTAG